jgi:hypothetical protein
VDNDGVLVGLSGQEAFFARDRIRQIANALMPGRLQDVTVVLVGGKIFVWAEITAPEKKSPPVITAKGQVLRRSGKTTVDDESALAEFVHSAIENKPALTKKILNVFVAMSFHSEEEPSLEDYYMAMKRAAEHSKTGISITRMDEIEGDYEISQALMTEIDHTDVVLADFTLSPQNVYYEVGYARGKGKTLILTARRGTRLEFDVRNWRTLRYRNATELEKVLVKTFDALGES